MAKRNKKGSLDDITFVLGVLLVFGFLVLIMGAWTDNFNTKIQDMDIIPADGKTAISKVNNLYPNVIDNGFLFLAIGLSLSAIIFAMLVIVHPIFFVLYVIMLTIVVVVSGALSNIYQQAAANPTLTGMANKLIFTSHILNFLPIITAVLGIIIAVIMYKNWQER